MKEISKKSAYDQQYAKEKIQQVPFRLNRDLDADIIEWLNKQPNKQGYLKQLIRADMERRS